jgi:hypothetical protein
MTSILIKIFAVLALLVALYFGEQHIEQLGATRQAAVDQIASDNLKAQAANVLAIETEKTRESETRLSALISKMESDRETLQNANRADLRARQSGPRLQFTAQAGRGAGGGGTQGAETRATCDAGPAVVQLPAEIDGRLRDLAADAQSLAIDYGVLHEYVHNPKLVCELVP